MNLTEISDLLRQSDPDRFGASLLAPAAARPKLWTLYALNLELARAPLQSNEPLIAEMRLQWWVDQLNRAAIGMVGSHDLLPEIAAAWGPECGELAALAEPRRRDCERLPFDTADEVVAYVKATAGRLGILASKIIIPTQSDESILENQFIGVGISNWLLALPALNALGMGLSRPAPELVSDLAKRGLEALDQARTHRRAVPRALGPALFAPAGTRARLAALAADGASARLQPSEFQHRFALGRLALTGRWWA